jgi:hypothetical protein
VAVLHGRLFQTRLGTFYASISKIKNGASHTIMIHHNLTKGAMRGTPMRGMS